MRPELYRERPLFPVVIPGTDIQAYLTTISTSQIQKASALEHECSVSAIADVLDIALLSSQYPHKTLQIGGVLEVWQAEILFEQWLDLQKDWFPDQEKFFRSIIAGIARNEQIAIDAWLASERMPDDFFGRSLLEITPAEFEYWAKCRAAHFKCNPQDGKRVLINLSKLGDI